MDQEIAFERSLLQSGRRPRQNRLCGRVLECVRENPGILQRDLFRLVGEKDILVLSVLDELIRDGVIDRRDEPARIYIAGEAVEPTPTTDPAAPVDDSILTGAIGSPRALSLIRLYRFLQGDLKLSVRFDEGLIASRDGTELLRAEAHRTGLVVRLRRTDGLGPSLFPGLPTTERDGFLTLGPLGPKQIPVLTKGLRRL